MNILIADDNQEFGATLGDIIESLGYKAKSLNSPDEILRFLELEGENLDLLLLDIEFGPNEKRDGLDILEFCRLNKPSLPVVMITGKGTIETAVKATKLGALNFIEKSLLSKDKIKEAIDAVIERTSPIGEEREILKFLETNGIIARSKKMIELGDAVARYGRSDLNVLITGETGSGKKLVAQAIHAVSRRANKPFVTVDIPNIPRELFQSELFGHVKGAFSGAIESKKGLFQKADKGTLFLDEIGDLPPDLQASLLIPIEEKIARKVGSTENQPLDVRFVSASDRNLVEMIKEGKFREQLYHRLRECEIKVPPLRERREDIPLIAENCAKKHNAEFYQEKYFSPSALEYLQERNWPGNVRELISVARIALQTSPNDRIEISDLHKIFKTFTPSESDKLEEAVISASKTLKEDLALVDKKKVEKTLELCLGNVTKAAAKLGVSRETLHNKIRKYDIDVQKYRKLRKSLKSKS